MVIQLAIEELQVCFDIYSNKLYLSSTYIESFSFEVKRLMKENVTHQLVTNS